MELFDFNVRSADEAKYDYSYYGVGYSDYGTKEVGTFKFGVLRSEEKNALCIKFEPIVMNSDDVLDSVLITAFTPERKEKLTGFLTDLSAAITNSGDYSDTTGILQYLVGLVVPMVIEPEKNTISFPLNLCITTSILEKYFEDKWICIEWGADKEFTEFMKELLVPLIQLFGEMVCPEVTPEEDSDPLTTLGMAEAD